MRSEVYLVSQETDLVRYLEHQQKANETEGESHPSADSSNGSCPLVVIALEGSVEQAIKTVKKTLQATQKKEFYAIISGSSYLKRTAAQIDSIAQHLNGHADGEPATEGLCVPSQTEAKAPEPPLVQLLEKRLCDFVGKVKRGRSHNVYDLLISECDRSIVSAALHEVGGNQVRASELLGLNRNTLRRKMKDLKIEVKKQNARPDKSSP